MRRRSGGLKIAAVGFILLCGFIVVRASSFHDMDAFLHTQVLNLYWNHVLELGGIAIVAAGAALARPSKRRKKRPPLRAGPRGRAGRSGLAASGGPKAAQGRAMSHALGKAAIGW